MRRFVLNSESVRPVTIATALLLSVSLFSTTRTNAQVSITTGIDTYLTSAAKSGPDGSYGTEVEFEWDGSDSGGFNQAMLYFDVSPDILGAFAAGSQAILKLRNTDDGSPGEFHRMTVNWLEGPTGGNQVSFNSVPDGPGIVPGTNAQELFNLSTGPLSNGTDYEFDVTVDVLAWAGGEPNYGWGIIPNGNGGNAIASFESPTNSPRLELFGLDLANGDFNEDGAIDSADYQILVTNFNLGTTFSEGDITLDGVVDLRDYVSFRQAFEAAPVGGATVPEPSGLALGLISATLLLVTRRRIIRA